MGHQSGGGGVETEDPGLAEGDQTKRHLGHQGFDALFRAQAALLFVGVAGPGVGQIAAQFVHHMAQRSVAAWRGLASGLQRVFRGTRRGRKLERRRSQSEAFVSVTDYCMVRAFKKSKLLQVFLRLYDLAKVVRDSRK